MDEDMMDREYVIIMAMGDGEGDYCTSEQAQRAEQILAERGWTVTIRTPRRDEGEGTYYVKRDGTLQIMGYSIPRCEALSEAFDDVMGSLV